MGTPTVPKPIKPPAPVDHEKAKLNMLAYAQLQDELRKTQGRSSMFKAKTPKAPMPQALGLTTGQ